MRKIWPRFHSFFYYRAVSDEYQFTTLLSAHKIIECRMYHALKLIGVYCHHRCSKTEKYVLIHEFGIEIIIIEQDIAFALYICICK